MIRFFQIALPLLASALVAGAQTRVRIEGSRLKTEAQLLELMGGRLEHVVSDPASSSRADDAAFLLRQIMRNDGYGDTRVDWRIVNPREILLIVDEGSRLSLGNVTIRGTDPEDAERLSKIYTRPASKDRPFASGTAPFREEDVEEGLAAIRQELNAMGYWAAGADLASREISPDTGMVDLTIDVKRGPRHRIGSPRIHSPDGRGILRTTETVTPFTGLPATTANINQMRSAVGEAFTSQGYPDSEILMGSTLESPLFIPEFTINLGTRVRLDQVEVNVADRRRDGPPRTNPRRLLRRLKPLEGDWYDEAAMNGQLRQFLATGAFSSARVEREELSPGRIKAVLHFEEAAAKEVTLGAGAGSYEGLILRAAYADRNLLGRLLGFSAGLELSSRGALGETRITEPWLFSTDYSLTARAYALIYGREGYQSFDTGLETILGRKFGDHYSVELLAGYSYINVSLDGLPATELGPTSYTNPKLRLTQVLDYRDNPVLPKSGWHLRMPLEIGAAVSSETNAGYVRGSLSGSWHHALSKRYDLAIGGEVAAVVPTGDSSELPIDLRIFNGGARSIRSFPERELGPTVFGHPTGGEASWTANVELIRDLTGPLRAVAFVDAGTLARSFDTLSDAEIEIAAGLGLRLELPIGPVRLEYGRNLTKDHGEPGGTFHFAIGIAF